MSISKKKSLYEQQRKQNKSIDNKFLENVQISGQIFWENYKK